MKYPGSQPPWWWTTTTASTANVHWYDDCAVAQQKPRRKKLKATPSSGPNVDWLRRRVDEIRALAPSLVAA